MKTLFALCCLMLAIAICAAPAHADSFVTSGMLTLVNCGNGGGCPAATYTFDVYTGHADLNVTINSVPGSGANHLEGVDLGFASSSSNLTGLSLYGSTDGGAIYLNGPDGLYTVSSGSLSNAGCGGNQGAFVCASSPIPTPDGILIAQNHTYTFTWYYDEIPANAIFDASDVHIGANYDPHNGWIVSETGATSTTPGAPVPEPSSLMLLGSGLIGLGGFARRRLLKA